VEWRGEVTQTPAQRRYVRLASSMNKKASRLGRNGRVTPEDLAWTFLISQGKCSYCGIYVMATECSFDHRNPFVAGGENDVTNIVATCLSCNRQKARRLAHEFALAREYRVNCEVCGRNFKPRWADHVRGYGRTCSAECAGKKGRLVRSGAWAR
jgi:5-methylcytosine-specific restriction endonuclease McrA